MEPVQSIAILLVLVFMAAAPWLVAKALKYDRDRLPHTLRGRDLVAYLLYVDHCRGVEACLERYERSADIRAPWLEEADRRLAAWAARQ